MEEGYLYYILAWRVCITLCSFYAFLAMFRNAALARSTRSFALYCCAWGVMAYGFNLYMQLGETLILPDEKLTPVVKMILGGTGIAGIFCVKLSVVSIMVVGINRMLKMKRKQV